MYKRTIFVGVTAILVLSLAAAGASVRIIREKDANLDISRRAVALLRAAGVTVVETRVTDATRSPAQRVWVSSRYDADLFVSLHNNSSPRPADHYASVYRQLRGGGSSGAATAIAASFGETFGETARVLSRRGDHGDYYFQLRLNPMPAVIVESAFVTNPAQARRLATSKEFRQQIAAAVANGILAWQRTLGDEPPIMALRGKSVTSPLLVPQPLDATASALDRNDVLVRWTGSTSAGGYRVVRNGIPIATLQQPADPLPVTPLTPSKPVPMSFIDRWAAPGQQYRYEIVATHDAPTATGVTLESNPATTQTTTPAITVCVDAGHGGADPGATAGY